MDLEYFVGYRNITNFTNFLLFCFIFTIKTCCRHCARFIHRPDMRGIIRFCYIITSTMESL